MPVGDGEQPDAKGECRADLRTIEGQPGREMVRNGLEHSQVKQQSKDKDAQLDKAGRDVRENLGKTPAAKVEGARDVRQGQASRDPQCDGN